MPRDVSNLVHFTGELTLGNLAIVVTLIGVAISIGRRIGAAETTLHDHAAALTQHSHRLDLYEGRLVDVIGQVQRVIGRVEVTQERLEQTLSPEQQS